MTTLINGFQKIFNAFFPHTLKRQELFSGKYVQISDMMKKACFDELCDNCFSKACYIHSSTAFEKFDASAELGRELVVRATKSHLSLPFYNRRMTSRALCGHLEFFF